MSHIPIILHRNDCLSKSISEVWDALLLQVATAVAKEALESGVAEIEAPADLEKYIRERMWEPRKTFDPASAQEDYEE